LACTISGNVASVSSGGFSNHDFLYNRGVTTLSDTIVASNTTQGGAPSDIGGPEAGSVTGSFNLIGPGGSGGIRANTQANIVLTSLAGVGLAPLGDYGGPNQTIALLPGSPALGAGAAMSGITTDQRGEPLDAAVDIGAFQSQGFVLAAAPGTTPQSAPTGEAFANPLVVTVVARNPAEPVAGGVVSFTVTPDDTGAGAGLSAATAVIGGDHGAQVTATANAIEGTYIVTASAAGGLTMPRISLTNLHNNRVRLAFTGLADESLSFGTATVTLSGTLAHGAQAPPPGEAVAVTLGGVTQQDIIGEGGAFTITFATAGLTVAGSPYAIDFRYTSDGTFASTSTTHTLSVTKATPTVSVIDPGGTFNDAAFAAMATVAGVDNVAAPRLEGVAPSLIYFIGTHTAAELAGLVPLGSAPRHAGTYTVVAGFPGSPDYAATQSAPVNVTIAQARTSVILLPHPVFQKKKLVSVTLSAAVAPLAPAAGIPSGVVKLMVNKKALGTLALGGGQAMLTVKAGSVLKKMITVVYGGDQDFQASQVTSPNLTPALLKRLTRPALEPRLGGHRRASLIVD
jgi:hypothetical protein